jgi:ABC-type Zn uptake system ZnuABC Zn-binding protein ZnuA
MKNAKTMTLCVLLLSPFILGIIPATDAQTEPVVSIAASIAPLGGIVNAIGKGYVKVTVLLPEGVDPHAAQLPQSAIQAAISADLLVLTGHFSWENSLAQQVSTPNISLVDYEAFGAALSTFPGAPEKENPHAYWLLPRNAIAIANATVSKLREIAPDLTDFWDASFNQFVSDVAEFENLVLESSGEAGFANLHVVAVTPAEAYIAETFGLDVVAVLEQDENVFISGADLIAVHDALANGSINLIVGSDLAKLEQGGQFAIQLAGDTGSQVIWWREIFFSGLSDYISLMTYNLGVLVSAMDVSTSNASTSSINYLAIGIAGVLSVVVLVETVLLVQRIRKEE